MDRGLCGSRSRGVPLAGYQQSRHSDLLLASPPFPAIDAFLTPPPTPFFVSPHGLAMIAEAERRLRAELDEDEEDASNTSRSGNSSMASGRGVGGVADLIVGLAEAGNEFYYFDPAMLKNWAGPNHWKFSKASKSKVSFFFMMLMMMIGVV